MISIIIPTHNRLELLQKKLHALEGQGSGFEVVVVVDGCADGTSGWLESYQAPYPLQVLPTEGLGAAGARNRGVEAAKGEIILLSDDDVILQPGCIQAHTEAHNRASQPTVFVGRLTLPPELQGSGAASMLGPKAFWWNFTGNNSSIRKDLWHQHGGFDENYRLYAQIQTGEDLDFGYRLKKAGVRFDYLPKAEAVHEAWSYKTGQLERARAHGFAHVKLAKKHNNMSIAWVLGVHPALVFLKLALLPSFKGMFRQGDYELAYAWGAWDALGSRDA